MAENRSVEDRVANLVLNIEIPFLSSVSLEDLVRIRRNHDESFAAFRLALRKNLKDLVFEENEEEVRKKLESLSYELAEIRTAEVDQELRRIRKSMFTEATLAAGSLAAAIPTNGLSLAGFFLAALEGKKTYDQLQSKVTSSPGHFLWKLKKETTS